MNSAGTFRYRLALIDRAVDFLRSRPVVRRRTLKRKLQAELTAAGSPVDSISLEHGPQGQPAWLVGVTVKANRIVLRIAPGLERSRVFWYLFDRLPAVLYPARLAGYGLEFVVDVSDGHLGFENVLGFCGNHESVWLVPDPDFYTSRGYAALRQQAPPDWLERRPEIIWRGSPNGQGLISSAMMNPDDAALIQRVRMCLLLRGQQGIDARLVTSDRTEPFSLEDQQRLAQAGITGQAVDQAEWWQRRFAIDIDGYTNAWSGLFTRLLMGCCVLKVASPTGHRQWYYHRLQPWQHYIPVAADLSDLQQRIEWCWAHERECERVAGQGRELALAMDFDTEYHRAAQAFAGYPRASALP